MLLFLFAGGLLAAEVPDTLQAVTIAADRGVIVSKTDTVSTEGTLDITEVLEKIPALNVGDNGGSAGLKTVSLRGFGSSHTSIYVDGVKVGNVQSGQTDLGSLGLENFGYAAVDYAQNSLSFKTARPRFTNGPFAGTIRLRGGSFGTYEPYTRLDLRISDEVCMSASAAGIISKGNFPFGDGQTRSNNDVNQIRGGLDFWGFTNSWDWHAKAYCNASDRGTPGSVSWPSTDRQKDVNAFVQGVVNRRFSSLYTLDLSAKAAYDDMQYLSEYGNDRYRQGEFQLNSSHRFRLTGWCSLSVAADLQWDGMKATSYEASRISFDGAVAAAFRLKRFKADVAVEYNGVFDKGQKSLNSISPSLDFRYKITESLDLTAFGRRAYRVPTFNELYYPGFGNPELQPEDAYLTDLGFEWNCRLNKRWKISAKADGFYSYLRNKIISVQATREDQYSWTPMNVGVVGMAGTDLQAGFSFLHGKWAAAMTAKYSYQHSADKTPGSATFGQQIPYIARNTAMLDASLAYSGWKLSAVWNIRAGRRDSLGEMPDWNTLDLSFRKDFKLPAGMILGFEIVARNITDTRYETASGYPMPGRSFTGGVKCKF